MTATVIEISALEAQTEKRFLLHLSADEMQKKKNFIKKEKETFK